MIRGKWWEIFNEPELNALEEQLNTDNQNIKLSFNNFMEARALVAQARAQYWPTITIGPSWSRSRGLVEYRELQQQQQRHRQEQLTLVAALSTCPGPPTSGARFATRFAPISTTPRPAPPTLSWKSSRNRLRLAQYYFEIRGQDNLQQILDETVDSDQKALDAAQGAYDAGTGDYISVVEAQATLKSAQSSDINVGSSASAISNMQSRC